jgi:NAD(P)-dependent dehydrogenase (short-subunit alcohol dehydrogenase family)
VPYGSTSDWVKNVHAAGGTGAYWASEQASRMLTWALADRLRGTPVTVNAFNPGYVVTDLTRRVGGLLKAVVGLTRFRAHTPLDGADTAISRPARTWTGSPARSGTSDAKSGAGSATPRR